jgi:hypothetical protein
LLASLQDRPWEELQQFLEWEDLVVWHLQFPVETVRGAIVTKDAILQILPWKLLRNLVVFSQVGYLN